MRDDRARLLDILDAIDKIEQRVPSEKELFFADELLQVWMIHHIQIIGEAASRLSPSLRETSLSIPWEDVISMRNVLVQYFGVDLEMVWDTISADIPMLKSEIVSVLRSIE